MTNPNSLSAHKLAGGLTGLLSSYAEYFDEIPLFIRLQMAEKLLEQWNQNYPQYSNIDTIREDLTTLIETLKTQIK